MFNKEKYNKEYRQKHRKELVEWNRKYRQNNPRYIFQTIRHGLKKRPNIELKITIDEFINWYIKLDKKCFYCKRTFKEILQREKDTFCKKFTRLSIDRIDNKKGYEKNNLVLSCFRCNKIKSNYFTKDEMLKIGKIIYTKTESSGLNNIK